MSRVRGVGEEEFGGVVVILRREDKGKEERTTRQVDFFLPSLSPLFSRRIVTHV